jgi:hypothetical protein
MFSMSGNTRIPSTHLRLVRAGSGGAVEEKLLLEPSARLDRFAAASAALGLDTEEAVRLALEHALALEDAAALGLDVDGARRRLNRAAEGAQAQRPLGDEEAARVRRLGAAVPRPAQALPDGLTVSLPEGLLTRARDSLTESAIRPAVVAEMVSWQIAAALAGRTLGEWALRTLAERRSAA